MDHTLARKCVRWIGLRVDIWLYVVFPRLGKYNIDILAWALGENPALTVYHLHHSIKMHYNVLARWLDNIGVQSINARAVAELYDNFEMFRAYITENKLSNRMAAFRGRLNTHISFTVLGGHSTAYIVDPQIVGCSGSIKLAESITNVDDPSGMLHCAILCSKMDLVRWCIAQRSAWVESAHYIAACACANAGMRVELIRMLHKAFPDIVPHSYAYAVARGEVFDELCKVAPAPEGLTLTSDSDINNSSSCALAAITRNRVDLIDMISPYTLGNMLSVAYGCNWVSFETIKKKMSRGMGWTTKAVCYVMANTAIIMGDLDTVKYMHAVHKLDSIALMNILAVRDTHPHLIEWALTEEWAE